MKRNFRKVPIQRLEGNFYSFGVISLLWLRFFECQDLGKAREFAESEDLHKTMGRVGSVGEPELYFLDEIEKRNLPSDTGQYHSSILVKFIFEYERKKIG